MKEALTSDELSFHQRTLAAQIIDAAISQERPAHVFLALSGGNDSVATSYFVAAEHLRKRKQSFTVLHVNTGIGIPQTREHVRSVCKLYGWELLEIRAKEDCGQDYEQLVLEYGFPGPSHHIKMYNRLKERCFEKLAREIDGRRFMLISGLRKQESGKRMRLKSEAIQVQGRRVWCAPFFFVSNDELRCYRQCGQLPESEVAKNLCMSGECLCGAYADPGELNEIEFFYPDVGRYLRDLEARVRAVGFPWGWDEKPPLWWSLMQRAKKFGQRDAFETEQQQAIAMACSSCEARRERRRATA